MEVPVQKFVCACFAIPGQLTGTFDCDRFLNRACCAAVARMRELNATYAALFSRLQSSTNKPYDFDHEGRSYYLRGLPCCVPQKERLLWAANASDILA